MKFEIKKNRDGTAYGRFSYTAQNNVEEVMIIVPDLIDVKQIAKLAVYLVTYLLEGVL
jgi:hypothetical protein